ncbi:MAG: hypothetical protein ACO2PN_23560 [Pyrobaculum sp.]|jgi:hypothetical protein
MSKVLLGGLVGVVGSMAVIRRVKEIKMYYADSGEHDVLIAVCVDSSCVVNHTDVDGAVYSDVVLNQNDLVLGGRVVVKSGRMFMMVAEKVGVV